MVRERVCQRLFVSRVVWEGLSGEVTFSLNEVRTQPFEGLGKIIPEDGLGPEARTGLYSEEQ